MKMLFLISMLSVASWAFGQESKLITQVELSKESRGSSEHIRVTVDSVFISKEDRKNSVGSTSHAFAIEEDQWRSLLSTFGSLKLNDIPKLSAPSMDRASDAAVHSTITVYTKDGKTYAHGFDNDSPNQILKPFIDKLLQFDRR